MLIVVATTLFGFGIAFYARTVMPKAGAPLQESGENTKLNISTSAQISSPEQNRNQSSVRSASASASPSEKRVELPRFSERFTFPLPQGKHGHARTVFDLLKPVLAQSRFWTGKAVFLSHGKQIPTTLIARFYDTNDNRSTDLLRSVTKPEHLAWMALGYFEVDGETHKWSTSSSLETVPKKESNYYLFIKFNLHPILGKDFEYLALPLPGQRALPLELLPAGPSAAWQTISGFSWQPLPEGAFRELVNELDHRTQPAAE